MSTESLSTSLTALRDQWREIVREIGTVQSVLQRKSELTADEFQQVAMLEKWRQRGYAVIQQLDPILLRCKAEEQQYAALAEATTPKWRELGPEVVLSLARCNKQDADSMDESGGDPEKVCEAHLSRAALDDLGERHTALKARCEALEQQLTALAHERDEALKQKQGTSTWAQSQTI